MHLVEWSINVQSLFKSMFRVPLKGLTIEVNEYASYYIHWNLPTSHFKSQISEGQVCPFSCLIQTSRTIGCQIECKRRGCKTMQALSEPQIINFWHLCHKKQYSLSLSKKKQNKKRNNILMHCHKVEADIHKNQKISPVLCFN